MNAKATPLARFQLGRIVITPSALKVIPNEDVRAGIVRHMAGDWGDLGTEDMQANERALKEGTRLLSAYASGKGVTFWIITEADRSATTILLPSDY
jgi:hypothetical protein